MTQYGWFGGAPPGAWGPGLGRGPAGLYGTPATSSCKGWESDRESFAKVIAEHYLITEYGRSGPALRIRCPSERPVCEVDFPDDVTVAVSLKRVPRFVIARRLGANTPRREYEYRCTPEGKVILSPRRARGRRTRRRLLPTK